MTKTGFLERNPIKEIIEKISKYPYNITTEPEDLFFTKILPHFH